MVRQLGVVSISFLACLVIALPVSAQPIRATTSRPDKGTAVERGRVTAQAVPSGGSFRYIPKREAVGILVLAHGQPKGRDVQDIPGLARRFAERWAPFAEEHGLVLLAPIFDDENFDSVEGTHGGGYRALYGRQVAADRYVEAIVERSRELLPATWDGRFVLYGHSAGGQFASRYAVRHPERIRALLVSAAGQFAMPDPQAAWPNGMAPLSRSIRWKTGEPQSIRIQSDPATWLRAATAYPTTVVVGSNDTEPQTAREGHTSLLRTDRAAQWVADMNQFARRKKADGQLKLVVVPGVGHDSAGLTPAAQSALAEAMRMISASSSSPVRPSR